jgi:hypothetical protein
MWFFDEDEEETLASADVNLDLSAVSLAVPLSLTRTTGTALGRDNSGRWVQFPPNTPRSWYDPRTLAARYTLVEPERTQLVYRTRQPTPTAVQSSADFDASVQTPFGLGAVHFVPNAVSAHHGWNLYFGISSHATTIPDNTTAALTAVVRPSGIYKGITFFLLNKNNVYSSARFLLEGDGSVVETTGVTSAEITRDTDDFYLMTVVNNFQAGATMPSFNGGFVNSAGTRTFAGDGASGYHLAYIGAEIGPEATSPIINPGTSVVVRPADVLTSTADWISGGAKTIGLTYTPLGKAVSTVLSVSGTDLMELRNGPGTVVFSALANGQQSALINATAPAAGVERTVVFTVAAGSALMTQDGILIGSDNTGTTVASNLSSIRFGDNVTGTNGGPVLLKQMKFWSEALPQDAAISYSGDLTQEFEDDGKPVISVQPTMAVISSASVVSLLVLMTGEPIGTTISYNTVDGTGLSGTDYVGGGGQLVIPVGQTSGIITVSLMPRGEVSDKTFKIILGSATGATIDNGVCEILLLRKMPENAAATTKAEFGATLPGTFSLTRTSPAWARDNGGVWTQFGVNGYRAHFVSPGSSGLLIEAAGTEQQLFDSVDPGFTATGGSKTVSLGEVTPTGTKQVQFRETTEVGQHKLSLVLTSSNSQLSDGPFTTSLLIRPVGWQYYTITVRGVDNIYKSITLDLTGPGSVKLVAPDIVATLERDPFRNSWYSVSLGRPQGTSSGISVLLEIAKSALDGTTNISGTGGNGFDIAHVQIEPGIGQSSPIIVTGASAKTVRAADVLKAAGTWHQRQSYSLGVRFRRLRDAPSVQRLWMAKDVAQAINGVVVKNGEMSYDLAGAVPLLFTEIVANGSQTVWELPDSGTDGAPYTLIVAIDGALQSSHAYSLSGNTLTLSEAPPPGAVIDVRGLSHASVLVESLGTGTRTIWTLPGGYSNGVATVLAMIDGVIQPSSSYTVSAGQLAFSQAPPLDAIVSLRGIGPNTLRHETVSTGTSTTLSMPISVPGPTSILVMIDGVLQLPGSYNTSTGVTQLSFTEAPPVGAVIDIRFLSS